MAIGGHTTAIGEKDEWITPRWITDALGPFDLDPCAPIEPPWQIAANAFSIIDNGLHKEWQGRVWLNPPYNRYQIEFWLAKLADHGDGVALVFARTETQFFFNQIWNRADGLLFLEGRLYFHHVDGTIANANSGGPSVLVAYGEDNATQLKGCGLKGKYVHLR